MASIRPEIKTANDEPNSQDNIADRIIRIENLWLYEKEKLDEKLHSVSQNVDNRFDEYNVYADEYSELQDLQRYMDDFSQKNWAAKVLYSHGYRHKSKVSRKKLLKNQFESITDLLEGKLSYNKAMLDNISSFSIDLSERLHRTQTEQNKILGKYQKLFTAIIQNPARFQDEYLSWVKGEARKILDESGIVMIGEKLIPINPKPLTEKQVEQLKSLEEETYKVGDALVNFHGTGLRIPHYQEALSMAKVLENKIRLTGDNYWALLRKVNGRFGKRQYDVELQQESVKAEVLQPIKLEEITGEAEPEPILAGITPKSTEPQQLESQKYLGLKSSYYHSDISATTDKKTGYHQKLDEFLKPYEHAETGINQRIGNIAMILNGNFKKNGKRLWSWNDRFNEIKYIYQQNNISYDESQKDDISQLKKIIKSNSYTKKKHNGKIDELLKILDHSQLEETIKQETQPADQQQPVTPETTIPIREQTTGEAPIIVGKPELPVAVHGTAHEINAECTQPVQTGIDSVDQECKAKQQVTESSLQSASEPQKYTAQSGKMKRFWKYIGASAFAVALAGSLWLNLGYHSEIDKLEDNAGNYSAQIKSLNTENKSIQETNQSLEDKISNARDTSLSQSQQINDLQNSQTAHQETIATMQTTTEAQTSEISVLTASLEAAQKDNQKLSSGSNSYESNLSRAEKITSTLSSRNKELEKNITNLEERLSQATKSRLIVDRMPEYREKQSEPNHQQLTELTPEGSTRLSSALNQFSSYLEKNGHVDRSPRLGRHSADKLRKLENGVDHLISQYGDVLQKSGYISAVQEFNVSVESELSGYEARVTQQKQHKEWKKEFDYCFAAADRHEAHLNRYVSIADKNLNKRDMGEAKEAVKKIDQELSIIHSYVEKAGGISPLQDKYNTLKTRRDDLVRTMSG